MMALTTPAKNASSRNTGSWFVRHCRYWWLITPCYTLIILAWGTALLGGVASWKVHEKDSSMDLYGLGGMRHFHLVPTTHHHPPPPPQQVSS